MLITQLSTATCTYCQGARFALQVEGVIYAATNQNEMGYPPEAPATKYIVLWHDTSSGQSRQDKRPLSVSGLK